MTLLIAACSSSGGEKIAAQVRSEEAGADRAIEEGSAHTVDAAIDMTVAETGHEDSIKRDGAPDGEAGRGDGAPDKEAGKSDGAPDGEAGRVDAETPIACNYLQEAWRAFVEANSACEDTGQCIVIGGAGTCGCGHNLAQGSGDAIVASARSRAEKYFTRYDECAAAGHHFGCAYDAAPARNLRCESGRCTVDQRSCIAFDAGRG